MLQVLVKLHWKKTGLGAEFLAVCSSCSHSCLGSLQSQPNGHLLSFQFKLVQLRNVSWSLAEKESISLFWLSPHHPHSFQNLHLQYSFLRLTLGGMPWYCSRVPRRASSLPLYLSPPSSMSFLFLCLCSCMARTPYLHYGENFTLLNGILREKLGK